MRPAWALWLRERAPGNIGVQRCSTFHLCLGGAGGGVGEGAVAAVCVLGYRGRAAVQHSPPSGVGAGDGAG